MQLGVRRRRWLNPPMEATTNQPVEAPKKRKSRRVDGLSQEDVVKHGVTRRSSLAHPRRLGHAGTRRLTLTPTWKPLKATTSEFN